MARSDPQLNFRIPVELRDKLDAAAKCNNRSLTGELIARLESTFYATSNASMAPMRASASGVAVVEHDEEIEGLRKLAALTYELQRATFKVDLFRNKLTLAWHDTQEAINSGTKEEAVKAKAAYLTLQEEMQRYSSEIASIEGQIDAIHRERKVAGLRELRDVEPIYASVRSGPMVDTGVVVHEASKKRK